MTQLLQPRAVVAERDDLCADLLARPEAFDLGTALRVAEAAGGDVAVHAPPSLRLAARPVTGAALTRGGIALTTSVAGLVGPLGAMPPAWTELASRQLRARARGLSAFLDLFATRLVALFVGAGEKYRIAPSVRWHGNANGIVGALFSLAGFGTHGLRAASDVPDAVLLRYAGLLANRTRSATALAAILAEHVGLPVEVEEFRGRWLTVAPDEQTRLGPGGGNELGTTAIAGQAVFDRQGSFRIAIGPVGYADYLTLAPGAARMTRVVALARLYAGLGLDFDVKVILRKEDVPETELSAESGARLGWNTFVRIAPAARDSHDAVVRPFAAAAEAA